MSPPAIQLRPASSTDIDGLVEIHRAAFPGFTLTLLGEKFLRLLYQAFQNREGGLLLVAIEAQPLDASKGVNNPIGFVAGTVCPDSFFRQLRRDRWLALGLAAVPSLFKHPSLVMERMFAAVRYRGDTLPELPAYALLSSLGVAPQFAGKGVGTLLVAAFNEVARSNGTGGVYLTTDAQDNERAQTFYTKSGFIEHARLQRAKGRTLILYVRDFSK